VSLWQRKKIQKLLWPRGVNCRGARRGEPLFDGIGVGYKRRYNFEAKLSEFVRGDLELVTVGIAKVNGLRDLVVLEFKFDSALF
jgi:hypothetical protein